MNDLKFRMWVSLLLSVEKMDNCIRKGDEIVSMCSFVCFRNCSLRSMHLKYNIVVIIVILSSSKESMNYCDKLVT